MKEITVKDFCEMFIPQAGFVLIEKDGGTEKVNGIILTRGTRERAVKWSGTGVIKNMSPFHGETDHDKYLQSIYADGDRVAFNTTSPIDVPIPPDTRFKDKDVALVLIHIADLLGYIVDDADSRIKIASRCPDHAANYEDYKAAKEVHEADIDIKDVYVSAYTTPIKREPLKLPKNLTVDPSCL